MDAQTTLNDWSTALAAFAEDAKRDRRYTTIKAHVYHLRTLADLAPGGPWTVTPELVESWAGSRGASRRNAWNAARAFYGWAVRVGYVAATPVQLCDRRPAERRAASVPESWAGPLSSYLRRLQAAGMSARTIKLRRSILGRLARAMYVGPVEVTTEHLAGWLAEHSEWSPATRKTAWVACRGFFDHLVRTGLIESSPAAGLGRVREPRGVPRPAPGDALADALRAGDDRERLMLVLAAYAGLRASEIAAVRPSTDVVEGFLHVTGKGGHSRRVPLHPLVVAELDAEQSRRADGRIGSGFRRYHNVDATADGWLFPSPLGGHVDAECVSRVLLKVLPGQWTGHTLRHRFASQVYAGCKDIRAVQELLGHASPATTARYTATTDDSLRAAVAVLS